MLSEDSFPVFNLDFDCQFENSDEKFSLDKKQKSQDTFTIEDGNISAFSTIGKRNHNLDTFAFLRSQNYTLLAIFDGHGDDQVAKFLERELLQRLSRHSLVEVNPEFAIKQVLSKIEEQVIQKYEKGSTALVAIIDNEFILAANIGDCKLFGLQKQSGNLVSLTEPHNLENQSEVANIMSKGGLIFKRSQEYRINGQLNISRSIGDRKHKKYMSSEPDFYSIKKQNFKKIMLISDGFYKHHLFEKQLCRRSLKQIEKKVLKDSTGYGFDDNATLICLKFKSPKNSIALIESHQQSSQMSLLSDYSNSCFQ